MTQESNINKTDKIGGAVSLKHVVASLLNKKRNYSKDDRKRLLQFAIEGYREFGLYHIPFIEYEWIKVNKNIPTVPLPDQLMEFMSVGIPIDGKMWQFTEIKDGIIPEGFNKLNESREEVAERDNQITQDFASPGGQNEYNYMYDKPNRRLVLFTPFTLDEVLIVYKSTGVNKYGNTMIPIHAFKALRAYVELEDIDSDDSVAMNEKERKRRDMFFHMKNMRDVENRFTVAQFLDAVRSGYGQTFKR